MERPDVGRLAAGLREQTDAFAGLVRGMDPQAPVPTCPRWRVRDLVGHIGQAHRWAAEVVRTGAAVPVPDPQVAEPGPPRAWPGWLREGAAELIAAVVGAAPEALVWSYLGPRPADFWLRRMLHDTCVHHADAALAAGSAFRAGPELAGGAIEEMLELLCAPDAVALKPELAALAGHGERLSFAPAAGPAGGWLVTRTGRGPRWRRGAGAADATVTAPLPDLLLLLTRRLPPTARTVTVTGDRALVDHWLEHTAL